jgi:SAM-dependent methyltransferase
VEIGCGSLGGFGPMLRSSGYEAVGVDPEAPEGADYRRVEFEKVEPLGEVDAVVASTSLHHVADPRQVIDRVAQALAPRGTVVVVEWGWERFDEATAQWCFQRLGSGEEGWLGRRRDEWVASGQPWSVYVRGWARKERLHAATTVLRLLDARFEREHLSYGSYFFPDLAQATEEDELAAIEAGEIRATRVDYVGRLG